MNMSRKSWFRSVGYGLIVAFLVIATGCVSTGPVVPTSYPQARMGDVVDDYNGVKVADPYRWLEDPDAPESRTWIEAQNKITYPFLHSIPQRKEIEKRLTKLWNYEKYGMPQKKGGRYFFTKNDGLQNQSVLYVAESLDAEPRVLLDPSDGTGAEVCIEVRGLDDLAIARGRLRVLALAQVDLRQLRCHELLHLVAQVRPLLERQAKLLRLVRIYTRQGPG